ncbi:MAG: pyruvate dehydrogenase, partial [Cyclobacteriaceae bacterium]|nr:pyruvate dehydrogenase [Cyclobacteriaceae bacterium]
MAEIVRMPKMSDTMTEGVIAKWHKKVGDSVKSGELMAEIETDKATMDYESFNEGVVLHLGAKEGQAVQVNDILAIVGKKGEDFSGLLSEGKQTASQGGKTESVQEKQTAVAEAVDTSGIKAEVVPMPKMSDTMTEGVIAAWHKKVGDTVKSGELMAEVETDKATMEYESYHTGTVLYIGAKEKESIPVNGVLAIIGEKDADWKTLLKAHQSSASATEPKTSAPEAAQSTQLTSTASAQEVASATTSSNGSNGRLKASPLAKKMAKEKGYDLSK